MTTASEIITRAAKTLGYLGRTETLSAADANDGLVAFNAILDSWSNEKLMSYVTLQSSFVLIPGQRTYTVGTGGYVNVNRPLDITQAFVRDFSNLDYQMRIIPRDKYDAIGNKTSVDSQIPDTLFYDSQFPLGVIVIYPIPLLNYSVFFNAITNQVSGNSLISTISMPIGYERAYVLNLALEMMSHGFPCLLNDRDYATLVNNASEAKANIKRTNIKEVIADYDEAIISRSEATYNVYSDNNPRG